MHPLTDERYHPHMTCDFARARLILPLLLTVLLKYVAQRPYYVHQYYFPHHATPSLTGALLLTFTFIWFLVGYGWFLYGTRYGRRLLLSFLLAQILFYGYSIILSLLTGARAVA